MRTNHGVSYGRACADEGRGNDGRIFDERRPVNEAIILFVFEHSTIGIHCGILVSTVEPLTHFTGKKFFAFVLHVLHSSRKLVLAFLLDVMINKMLQLAPEIISVFEIINADDGK